MNTLIENRHRFSARTVVGYDTRFHIDRYHVDHVVNIALSQNKNKPSGLNVPSTLKASQVLWGKVSF